MIKIKNVSHRFSDGFLGINKINLEIQQGEFVVIAGANGSGKTTLCKHLNGLLLPDTGSVVIDGIDTSDNPAKIRQIVGMVFQDADSQIVGETVSDDVAFGPENLCLDRLEINKRVAKALESAGLTHLASQSPYLLSGGEKRKLAIAGVLAMNPKVLVFDEPFANLDYPAIKQVLEQILLLHQAGNTIVVATHDIEKVIAHANRLIIMKNGEVARNDSPLRLIKEAEKFGIREPCASRLGAEVESWLD